MMTADPMPEPRSDAQRRPLSPHLSIYRPTLTMMMSIAHRITGSALYFGMALLALWLLAAASGEQAFATAQAIVASWPGQIVLFLFTWALMHHMLGGVRHLIWDTGHGFSRPAIEFLGRATLIGGILLTALIWIAAFFFRGGL